jgi:hypothetical protein
MYLRRPLLTASFLILLGSTAYLGCGGGEPLGTGGLGTLRVTTSTTGAEPDADGYQVQIDNRPAESIGSSGNLEKTDLEPGDHVVQLVGVAGNCSVAENPRTVAVISGQATQVSFQISCTATSGDLRVTSATSGPSPDPDGYTITLDGAPSQTLGTSGEITLHQVPLGAHSVGLSGVADNCEVQGSNPRNVAVSATGTVVLAFSVRCVEPPAVVGTLRIVTATTGPDQDEDGYTVAVDGGTEQPIGVAGTTTLANTAAGEHRVQLSGVTANCTVGGANPRRVTVTSGELVEVRFSVTCLARPPVVGTIQVNTSTSGTGSDPDGYAVSVNGGPEQPIGINASLSLADLPPGDYSVGLSGVADNCRLSGESPRTVTVTAGVASLVAFEVACTDVPTIVGTLNVITATSGPDPDPDGYMVSIDGEAGQSVGINATTSIANVAVGSRSVGLEGLAANCTLEGDNPRSVTIVENGVVELSFQVTCVPGSGGLTVTTTTTGGSLDPDGYQVSVDGGEAQAIGVNGSHTMEGLALGPHQVTLSGLAGNCEVTGENPRTVSVAASETTTVPFAVSCTATTGSLALTISGLPAGSNAAVTVSGPNQYSQVVSASGTLSELAPGTYAVSATAVTVAGVEYRPNPAQQSVEVGANAATAVTVAYGPVTRPSLNFRIDGVYLTQSTQTYGSRVPLIAGRDAYIRVFVVASESNVATPSVRVRFYRSGVVTRTLTIPSSGGSTPLEVDEGQLGRSWNLQIPGALIESGTSILADVDPANAIVESDETDNAFPANGAPRSLEVRTAPAFSIRFVPVRQRANGLQGNVTESNKEQYLDLTRRIYPLSRVTSDVHAVYTTATSTPLSSDLSTWSVVLGEIHALRTAEGSSAYYYGVVNPGPGSPWAGVGFLGAPAALGYDAPSDRSRVTAHELGHNWNRHHAPCGNPGAPDPRYPYTFGLIGVYGFDVGRQQLRAPYYPDIMGYCVDPWISDYTYQAVLAYRSTGASLTSAAPVNQPCLLLWGRIVNGQAVLEPAFLVVTRPSLPSRPGAYRIEGRSARGTLFSLAFDALEVPDDPSGTRHFAFAVPLDDSRAAQLESIRLSGPGAQALMRTRSEAQLRAAGVPESVTVRRTAEGMALQWNAATHPMLLVRDAETGEVLSFARGGQVELPTAGRRLEVTASDQVLSRRAPLRVQ